MEHFAPGRGREKIKKGERKDESTPLIYPLLI